MIIDNNSSIKNQIAAYNANNAAQVNKQLKEQEQSATNGAITAITAPPQRVDKLEISNTAKNYTQIFDRIKSGEYDKPEIVNAVSRKLSKLV